MLVEYDYSINQEGGHVWELLVLLPLRDLSGHIVCHIMMFGACQIEKDIVEVYYFIGNWDAASRKFTKWTDRMQRLDLGHGTFTGPSGFVTPRNYTGSGERRISLCGTDGTISLLELWQMKSAYD